MMEVSLLELAVAAQVKGERFWIIHVLFIDSGRLSMKEGEDDDEEEKWFLLFMILLLLFFCC